MGDSDQRYSFVCPACSGYLSIALKRIPPVQARFRCPHCKKPMDFPSREEARAQIQARTGAGIYAGGSAPASAVGEGAPASATSAASPSTVAENAPAREGQRFRIEKPGYQMDVFDRRGLRNLIRTGELLETDRICVDESPPVTAGELPYLQSLFALAKKQKTQPPACCRTHTDKVAFFRCHNSSRPLCEDCAPEKKFGGQTIRVCQHCGGTAVDLITA